MKPACLLFVAITLIAGAAHSEHIYTGDELVGRVLQQCGDMGCVKEKVLHYLDTVLNIEGSDARDIKNIDAAIFKRIARVFQTHEFHMKLPEMLFGDTEVVYSPRIGLDIASSENESRGILKKKLLFPALLLLKLKMKALMPIFVAIIGIKAMKALLLSKIAIILVVGFIAMQLLKKNGMMMPMSMMPMMPMDPSPAYGAPAPTMAPMSSYDPNWEPSNGGPYSRVWTNSAQDSAQGQAYSAYYPGASSSSSSTTRSA